MGMEKHQSTFVSVCEIVLNSVGGHVLNVGHLRLKRKIKKRRRPAAAAAHLVFVQKYFLSSSLSSSRGREKIQAAVYFFLTRSAY